MLAKITKWAFAIGLSVVSMLVAGKMISLMWEWFVIPIFPGAPVVDTIHAAGLNFLFSFPLFVANTSKEMDRQLEKLGEDPRHASYSKQGIIVKPLLFIFLLYPFYMLWVWGIHHFAG